MTRDELIKTFDDFVLRNAKRSSSFKAINAASMLANAKNMLNNAPAKNMAEAKMIIRSHDFALKDIVPGPKSPYHEAESECCRALLAVCNEA